MRLLSCIAVFSLLFVAACRDPNAGMKEYQQAMQYWQGEGVEKDAAKALALFTAAADAGNTEAQLTLGYLYMKGDGVTADAAKALALFTSAAQGGSRDAQYNVGLAYMRGQGVSQDLTQAYGWFLKAAEQGDSGAQYNVGVMLWNGEGAEKNTPLAMAWFTLAAEGGDAASNEQLPDVSASLTPEQKSDADRLLLDLRKKVRSDKTAAR